LDRFGRNRSTKGSPFPKYLEVAPPKGGTTSVYFSLRTALGSAWRINFVRVLTDRKIGKYKNRKIAMPVKIILFFIFLFFYSF